MKIRNLISLFFLSLYLTTIFTSLLPYIEYALNYHYISTVLCVNKDVKNSTCNGKCHLKKQLSKVIESKYPSENKDSKILTLNDYDPAIVNTFIICVNKPNVISFSFRFKDFSLTKGYIRSLYKPPILIS